MKDWQAANKAAAAEEEKNVHTLQKAQSQKFTNPPIFSRHDQQPKESGLLNYFKKQNSFAGPTASSSIAPPKEVKVTTVTASNLSAFKMRSN